MEISTDGLEELINICLLANDKVSKNELPESEAVKIAALTLSAQLKLAQYIETLEIKYKNFKNKLSLSEAEKYFSYKTEIASKLTEAALNNHVASDAEIVSLKEELVTAEAQYRKMMTVYNTVRDAHIFFRTLAKSQKWGE